VNNNPSTRHWLRGYEGAWLQADIIAGITLAAYLLPSAIGDASLANLPPQAGLYACLFSGLVFWLLCSSRHTAIAVTSAISLLVGSSLGEVAGGDTSRFGALAACTALLVAALAFIAWLIRAGAVLNFVSETVLVGFKCGIALVLTSTQLPKLFGFKGSHGNFWERMGYFLGHIHETHPLSLALGAGALAILLMGKRFLKNKPVALAVMLAGIALASLQNLGARGVNLLGAVPNGLPTLGLPAVHASDVNDLLPLAMACFLLGAVETAAIGRMFALKHGTRFVADREFLALAASNLMAGLGRAFPVSGGMSQSLVNESAGARTPLSSFVAALITLLVALFFSDLLSNLPQSILAAVVLVAVTGLLRVDALQRLWKFNRGEFAVAIAALIGVLGSGILRGVLIGVVLSLLLLLRRASRPFSTEMARVPGTPYFADFVRHPENERPPGVFVFRSEASLVYFNVDYVRDRFFELLAQRKDPVRVVIYFLGAVPAVDLSGAELLSELHTTLKGRGIELKLAEARSSVCETLDRSGYVEHCGPVSANRTVADLLADPFNTPVIAGPVS
jgi:SulP family sulfate permease